MRHPLAVLCLALALGACGGRPLREPPLFPFSTTWKTELAGYVVPPLATDGRRVFVATSDGSVSALDLETGGIAWRVEDRPGRLSAAPGLVLVRSEGGTVWSLRPRNGSLRWTAETVILGTLPPTLDADRFYVAGRGLAALESATGHVLWSETGPPEVTAPPAPTRTRLLVGEADGTLRCRDRETGVSLWTYSTAGGLKAPPLVDEERRRVYLGTTDRRIVELTLDRGEPGWRWKVGADIQSPGLLLPDHVLFASFDAVLYGLNRGGSLAWRAPLPSRPISGPLLLDRHVVVACHENEILGFTAKTGQPVGGLRTTAEIRTPPLLVGDRIVVGLRDRSVVGYVRPTGPRAPSPAAEPEDVEDTTFEADEPSG